MTAERRIEEYEGHRIVLDAPTGSGELGASAEAGPTLLIDDIPVPHGQFPDGTFALHESAYEWGDDLVDLARRLIDHRKAAFASGRPESGGGS